MNRMGTKFHNYNSGYLLIKRLFDIVMSFVGLVISSPVILITSIAILIDDFGPVFYSQTRIGKNGKEFKILKFRSMYINADKEKVGLIEQNEVNGAMFKIQDDPRITRVGNYIRRHSIDEIPQLINVLIGDMTIVGPRPPLPEEVRQYTEYDLNRLVVKPGCTGLWQVSGRNALDFDEMVELDLTYINEASMLLDFKICIKTVWIMICPNNAY